MKTITLNIGLAITGDHQHLHLATVQAAIGYHGLFITRARVAQSNTEPTVIAECIVISPSTFDEKNIHALAVGLDQEAIAWTDEHGVGHVTGPQAAKWGAFNPAFFLPVENKA